MSPETKTVWAMIEEPPVYVAKTADLFQWAMACEHRKPWTLFLDLVGFSAETYGYDITACGDVSDGLGYVELDYLGEALREYATNPNLVTEWITELLSCEP